MSHLKLAKGIPDFWSQAVTRNPMAMEYFHEKDLVLIDKITKITSERTYQPRSLTVIVEFSENDFFTNLKLSYTVVLKDGTED